MNESLDQQLAPIQNIPLKSSEDKKGVKKGLDESLVQSLTLAMSPEFCCGWENAEMVFKIACEELMLDFTLPK